MAQDGQPSLRESPCNPAQASRQSIPMANLGSPRDFVAAATWAPRNVSLMRGVWVLSGATVRAALRTPAPWLLTGAGLLLLWAGLALDILALSGESRALEIGAGTAETVACLGALWVWLRANEGDRWTHLGSSLDAATPGWRGRCLGRWLGAVGVAALAAGVQVAAAFVSYCYVHGQDGLYLYCAVSVAATLEAACLVSWALLAARWLPPVATAFVALALLVAARALPAGFEALLPLPVEPRAPAAGALAAEALAVAGLLGLGFAAGPGAEPA